MSHSNCKDLPNIQVTAQGHVVFISGLFAYSRLSLYFQGLNKVYITSNMFIQVQKKHEMAPSSKAGVQVRVSVNLVM